MEGGGGGGGSGNHNPRTVEEVFKDFKSRRAGMIKALTSEVEKFYQQCDPEKENLCLYGLPNESWEVNLPAEEVPPELPEPALGINFARDGMQEKDWLALVAVHSDAWLLAVAFYFGARFGFDKNDSSVEPLRFLVLEFAFSAFCYRILDLMGWYEDDNDVFPRRRLFQMMNDLPTIFEVVTGVVKKQPKEKSTTTPISSIKTKSSGKMQPRQLETESKGSKMPTPKDEDESGEEEDDEQGATLCGACGDNYGNDEFWICCDVCERWFHGKCVKITPARAEHIKQYKCPACSNKRARV